MPVNRGLTLLELLVSLAILIMLLGIGVPALRDLSGTLQLRAAAQESYGLLQFARVDALRSRADRFVVWSVDNTAWCAVVSERNNCNCLTEQCAIAGVLRQQQSTDFSAISLAAVAFSSGNYTRFDGLRGLAVGHAGRVAYQLAPRSATAMQPQLQIIVSGLGRLRWCQVGHLSGYPAC